MKKQLTYFPFFIFLIASCNQKSEPAVVTKNENQLMKDSLTEELKKIQIEGHFNGFGVAIVNEEGTLYEQGFGYGNLEEKKAYTENTIQHIASISKTLIGIGLMKAQEMGKLNLDDPIDKYLSFEVKNPYYKNDKITIRHLATHTSTISDTKHYMENAWIICPDQDLSKTYNQYPEQRLNPFETNIPMEDFLKKVLSENGEYYEKEEGFLNNKPGDKFKYSNIGATLAALVLEKAIGEKFNVFTKKHILNPLKMNDSGWSLEEIDLSQHSRLYSSQDTMLPFYTAITYPDGMLITSSSDMAKYLTELIKGYSGTGTLLSNESYKELFRVQLTEDNYDDREKGHPFNDEYDTGIFMGLSAFGYAGHAGGDAGVATWMFFDKETKTGRFFMKNTDINSQEGFDQYFGIWEKLGEYIPKLDK